MTITIKTKNSVANLVHRTLKADEKIDKLRKEISALTGRPCWTENGFRDGKIIGVLRTIGFEFKHRSDLLELSGIPEVLLDIFLEAWGHPCFIDKKSASLVEAKPMSIETVKECLEVAGELLGVKPHLVDITEARVAERYRFFEERAKATLDALN
jgi:hypothetical protein